jgi:hypothetical protein
MPPVEKQLHGERVFAALDVLKQLQASTITEIDALMPSILDRAFNQKL